MNRACGVLLPISSLPGPYGIGTFGKEAYTFVDHLEKAKQSYWQILPLSPTGYGDSPYQSSTAFAGNPNYIDLDTLVEEGWIDKKYLEKIDWESKKGSVDYGKIWNHREEILKKAYEAFLLKVSQEELKEYVKKKDSLAKETRDYCIYQAIKKSRDYRPWYEWGADLVLCKPDALALAIDQNKEWIDFYIWEQIIFFTQWKKLKTYANKKNIKIIGDMPIYVSYDSSESWLTPELFWFDADRKPLKVAGCPPDYFSEDGQLWGNPLYDWSYHKKENYAWWIKRFAYNFSLYDYVRVDHFRGFDEYYAIDAKATTAKEGKWLPGPNLEIFDALRMHFKGVFANGELPIIAEDMGILTKTVIEMVKKSGFPPMKLLEFAYDSDSENFYLPHNYERNCVAYTGTHDNMPLRAWIDNQSEDVRRFMVRYQGSEHTPVSDLHWDCIRTILASIADTVIIPMQDYLGLGEEARMNEPGTLGKNWCWRMKEDAFSEHLIWHMGMLAEIYARFGVEKEVVYDTL